MKLFKITIILCFILNIANAQNKYENNIFSINTLKVGENTFQSTIMFLPVSENFSPNVNIQIQSYSGTLKEYQEISMNQFKVMKLNIINNNLKKDYLEIEYSGNMGSSKKNAHWYAVAYSKNKKIYLITATALENQWKKYSTELIECVKSFNFK